MGFTYPAVDSGEDFGTRLLQALVSQLGSSLIGQGVSQGLEYQIGKVKAADAAKAAQEQHALGSEDRLLAQKQAILANAIKGLPELDQGKILMENWTDPERAYNANWTPEPGPRMPKEPLRPAMPYDTDLEAQGKPQPLGTAPLSKGSKFFWQAKMGQNQLTNRGTQPKMFDSTGDATGGRYRPSTIKTGTTIDTIAETNPEAYDWAKKGKGQREQEFKTFIEKLRGDNRLQVEDKKATTKSATQNKDLAFKREQLAQQLDVANRRLDILARGMELKGNDPRRNPQYLKAKLLIDQANIAQRANQGMDAELFPEIGQRAEEAVGAALRHLDSISDETGAVGTKSAPKPAAKPAASIPDPSAAEVEAYIQKHPEVAGKSPQEVAKIMKANRAAKR